MTTCLSVHNNADYTRLYAGQPSSLNLHNTYMQINQVALIFTTITPIPFKDFLSEKTDKSINTRTKKYEQI